MAFEPQYSCVPLPGLHQHLASSGVPLANEKWPVGAAAAGGLWGEVDRECAMDPALSELRQHLMRHSISFVVFDMDLTVTARHTRGHLARDPDTMALYLESARVTDALKVRHSKTEKFFVEGQVPVPEQLVVAFSNRERRERFENRKVTLDQVLIGILSVVHSHLSYLSRDDSCTHRIKLISQGSHLLTDSVQISTYHYDHSASFFPNVSQNARRFASYR